MNSIVIVFPLFEFFENKKLFLWTEVVKGRFGLRRKAAFFAVIKRGVIGKLGDFFAESEVDRSDGAVAVFPDEYLAPYAMERGWEVIQ